MNILVTGATGRIGSRLVPRLLQRGDSVRVLVRHPEYAQSLKELGAQIILGDLLDSETITHAVAETDTIIHLAAFFRGATPEEAQAVNLKGTVDLAEAALRANVSRFIFSSTNLVYGPGHGEVFHETDPLLAVAPYPKTKAAAESALLELHRSHGLDLRILRLAFVYGESDPHLSEGLQWFRQWNPIQKIHLLHHADVAQALMLAVDSQGIDGQIYNVADDEPVTAAEIMQLHGETLAKDGASRKLDAAWAQIVDTGKIRNDLGFRAIYPSLHSAFNAGAL